MALKAASEGRFKSVVDQTLPLGEAALAHEIMQGETRIGKILLDPRRLS
jgi:NADPH:quinone reductase-like Zn-dependent oxidoreductase